MKSLITKLVTAAALLGITSCATGPGATTGTVAGGLLGAGAGAIIGHQSGHGVEGALIGGATGAVAGNVIGAQSDRRRYDRYNRPYYYDSMGRVRYYR